MRYNCIVCGIVCGIFICLYVFMVFTVLLCGGFGVVWVLCNLLSLGYVWILLGLYGFDMCLFGQTADFCVWVGCNIARFSYARYYSKTGFPDI